MAIVRPELTEQQTERAALITGAAGGLGLACARRLAQSGLLLILTDYRAEAIQDAAREVQEQGGRAVAIAADLSSAQEIVDLAERCRTAYGYLDVLVNCAGVILPKGLAEATVEEWDRMMAINLRAVFLLCQALLPDLRRRRGAIVNIASVAGLQPQAGNGPYCIAKAGVIMLTRALAQDLVADGVRVNCVCPDAMDTPLLQAYIQARGHEATLATLQERHLLIPPDDVATVIQFLLEPGARSLTGQVIVVDRGALLLR